MHYYYLFTLFITTITSQSGRYDLDIDEYMKTGKEKFKFVPYQAPQMQKASSRLESTMPSSGPFVFEFSCSDKDKNRCEKAKDGFENAGKQIAKLLQIITPIKVKASFDSFCHGNTTTCDEKDIIGMAAPASYTVGKPTFNGLDWFMYPQGLVKQLKMNGTSSLGGSDIVARFNSDIDFHFRGDKGITPTQTDFELIITHELTHGLGITTSWASASNSSLLTPRIISDGNEWSKLTIYDKYIQHFDLPMTEYAYSITQQSPKNYDKKRAEQVFRIFTSNSAKVGFKCSNGILARINTQGKYEEGSSILHLDQSYGNSSDFLMTAVAPDGKTLEELGKGRVYGDVMIGVLRTLGWGIVGDQGGEEQKVYLRDGEVASRGYRNSVGWLGTLLFIFICNNI